MSSIRENSTAIWGAIGKNLVSIRSGESLAQQWVDAHIIAVNAEVAGLQPGEVIATSAQVPTAKHDIVIGLSNDKDAVPTMFVGFYNALVTAAELGHKSLAISEQYTTEKSTPTTHAVIAGIMMDAITSYRRHGRPELAITIVTDHPAQYQAALQRVGSQKDYAALIEEALIRRAQPSKLLPEPAS